MYWYCFVLFEGGGVDPYAEAINCKYSMMMINGGRTVPSTMN